MSTEPLVLVVDDDVDVLEQIRLELSGEGFRVLVTSNDEEALQIAEDQPPDITFVDSRHGGLMLSLRERIAGAIVLLRARSIPATRQPSLEVDADECLLKPFNADQMDACIRSVLGKGVHIAAREPVVLRAQDIEIDFGRRLVLRDGKIIPLSRNEWKLLHFLARNAGKLVLNRELLSKVWGPDYRDDLNYLRVWVSRLRRKLEWDSAHPRLIRTLQGIGYLFDAGGEFPNATG